MKKFEEPTIEFIPFGEDIITTSNESPKIKDGKDNNSEGWSGFTFG